MKVRKGGGAEVGKEGEGVGLRWEGRGGATLRGEERRGWG